MNIGTIYYLVVFVVIGVLFVIWNLRVVGPQIRKTEMKAWKVQEGRLRRSRIEFLIAVLETQEITSKDRARAQQELETLLSMEQFGITEINNID